MGVNWQIVGIEAGRAVFYVLLSLAAAALAFRKYIAPELTAALEEATKTASMLGNLGAIKKHDLDDEKALEQIITSELIMDKMPDIQLLKLALSPGSWEQVEEMIESNPAAALKMYEKYKHLLGGTEQKQENYMF